MQNRDFSKEIFTTNYDLIIEKSLEAIRAPYFDGFVGSYEPFFWQESVETLVRRNDLTQNWIRLWKIHGSLSWFWKKRENLKSHKVIRLGKIDKIEEEKNEIVIYPSKEKYDLSRRQPFLVYFDRLKNYLLSGELLFIFTGYSFLDQQVIAPFLTEAISRIRPYAVYAASVCSHSTPYSDVRYYKTIATEWHSSAIHPVM
ncbi:SIR2 family protein [Yersinia ruckeri]|nr:SIR2 family protein [Yersinia ruckeri]UIM92652.1 SIR2 family protein [Yersinia ruckeri]UIM95994.1 SIR2 family protein [Yersinia ruckeri]